MINLNAKDILKKTRGVGGADHSSRRRMSQSRSRRSSVIEALEPRVLLTVTINNGLLTTNPNYFQVTVAPADRSSTPSSARRISLPNTTPFSTRPPPISPLPAPPSSI